MVSTRTPFLRALLLAAVAGLVATACTSGGDGLEELQREVEGEGGGVATSPEDVEPPPAADPSRSGRVGIIIQTNSRTWGDLLGAAGGKGVVVVFVQPGTPAEAAGLQVGDLITEADGDPVTNAERAVVVLRSQPGEERVLAVRKPDGSEADVTITAEVPGDIDQVATYSQALEGRPDDPVLHYLRAQEWPLRNFDEAMQDVRRAIELKPEFVEAIEVRANRRWITATRISGLADAQKEELQEQAMADWNLALRLAPDNLLALVHRSKALSTTGRAASGQEDAEKAVAADETTPEAHFALGLAHFAEKEDESALVPSRRAIALNPYNVEFYQLLANVFKRLGQMEDARATIDAIIDLIDDPNQREALLRIVEQERG